MNQNVNVDALKWSPLRGLAARFAANLAALSTRRPTLADALAEHKPPHEHFVAAFIDQVFLAKKIAGRLTMTPCLVPPAAAANTVGKLTAQKAHHNALVVAGVDYGWLWDALYRHPVDVPVAPGHRPPLYFLSREIDDLWAVLHLQDWQTILTDRRTQVFAGHDCVAQMAAAIVAEPETPAPRVAATIDPSVWPEGVSLDTILADAAKKMDRTAEFLRHGIDAAYGSSDETLPADVVKKFVNGKPLRVLGITSRFTTFLQHSMRDWLAALAADGHETQLLMETADHERLHLLTYLRAFESFRPDLVLMIDHYRGEFPLMPTAVPAVMWIQDRLSNIFRPAAGASQGVNDYTLGFGRRDCVGLYNYPRERFVDAQVGVNETRFDAAQKLTESELAPYRCEVAFVSHASAPPDRIIRELIDRETAEPLKRLLTDVHDRLAAVYAKGNWLTQTHTLHRLILDSMTSTRVELTDLAPMFDIVANRLNNAHFRHTALPWLADAGVDLRLYGNGWESHPTLGRFARGAANNATQLPAIYRAAAINLQIAPTGSAHQRLFEGLSAGGFFLLRHVTGDEIAPLYARLAHFVEEHDIRDNAGLAARADSIARTQLAKIAELNNEDPLAPPFDFVDSLRGWADSGFQISASTIWPDEYPQVSFSDREGLLSKVRMFLGDPQKRAALADKMKKVVVERATYRAISCRLIDRITTDIRSRSAVRTKNDSRRAIAEAA